MTISYNWLSNYLPVHLAPEQLSAILTSIGLEVESLTHYESVKGGLKGLLIGEVKSCEKHPNADKLSLTKVDVGGDTFLSIVCGAPNVATGQKVVVAPIGATLYPVKGEPVTMKKVTIRGAESQGMICAGDEMGVSEDHAGILVLDPTAKTGSPASDYFPLYTDWIIEIGLTPNRMDAMSHWGVARDVCAYLSHHESKTYQAALPEISIPEGKSSRTFNVTIRDTVACQRYTGVYIDNVQVKESPEWLQQQLKAIGLRPINNIVDITNYILHETGQPLHAFDASAIKKETLIVQTLPADTPFVTLDGKEILLHADDLMICNGAGEPLCIGGVYGGLHSGVKASTSAIFLESAWFHPVSIRKTSFRHGLRTDAATRFEKNTNIDATERVLKRAAALICEWAGGTISSPIVDVYPAPTPRKSIALPIPYLIRLSGKKYTAATTAKILQSLDFTIKKETDEVVEAEVPYSKPDIQLPADLVEEVMRIDGLDNIAIPQHITVSPSHEEEGHRQIWTEKTANFLSSIGFNEILTNSITNSVYLDAAESEISVRLLNTLSAEHNVLRPSLIYTGLESIAHNLNRRNTDLLCYEFGKVYQTIRTGHYREEGQLCLFATGRSQAQGWRNKPGEADLFYLKGVINSLTLQLGMANVSWVASSSPQLQPCLDMHFNGALVGKTGQLNRSILKKFGVKQPVYFAELKWDLLLHMLKHYKVNAQALPKQLPVTRDLAMLLPATMPFHEVEKSVKKHQLNKLESMQLFDIFEDARFGSDKKSIAVSFSFLDPEKTLTDEQVDQMMHLIMEGLQDDLRAEIRKQ